MTNEQDTINFNEEKYQEVRDYLNGKKYLKQKSSKGGEFWFYKKSTDSVVLNRRGSNSDLIGQMSFTNNFPEKIKNDLIHLVQDPMTKALRSLVTE